MIWLLMWLNVSVVIINATLQLLVIYKFSKTYFWEYKEIFFFFCIFEIKNMFS